MRRTARHNGVELGAGSPLLTKGGAKRYLGPSEHEIQVAYITAIRYKIAVIPDLDTLYAIPNFSGRLGDTTYVQGAKLKAEGRLPGVPDIHWPVARGPFIGLYIEFKIPGKYPTADQRAMHDRLREQGHCVVISREVQHAVDLTLRYDDLGLNRPSVRPVQGQWPKGSLLIDVVREWRIAATVVVAG